MSKDPIESDQAVSRRRLLEKAALAVGAATSVVAARSALARSSDVAMDSAGRVLIHGAALPAQRLEGSIEVAAGANGGDCINTSSCTGSTNWGACTNQKTCLLPSRAMQPTGVGPKVNAPLGGNALTGPKVNAPLGGNSPTSPKLNTPTTPLTGSRK
jgi:hypothetical protein